jgi:hypothetical protein
MLTSHYDGPNNAEFLSLLNSFRISHKGRPGSMLG